MPGPGTYETPTRQARAFSISGKVPTKVENSSPGPGAYEHKSTVSKKGITMSGKLKQEGEFHDTQILTSSEI